MIRKGSLADKLWDVIGVNQVIVLDLYFERNHIPLNLQTLSELTCEDLLSIKGICQRTVLKLQKYLQEYGMDFKNFKEDQ